MQVIATGGPLGAEITAVDLSKDLSAAEREFIFKAYIDNLVLLFRGLSLDESEALLDEIWAHTCRDQYVWGHKPS